LVNRDLMLAPEGDIYGNTCKATPSTAFVTGTTKLALTGDDAVAKVASLPFTMPYYDESYGSLWVSTNGFLSFVDPGGGYYNEVSLPDRNAAPVAAVAPYLSDLVIDASAGIYTGTSGTGTAQKFIVEWRNALIAGTTSRVTFEAILGATGDITLNYSGLVDDLTRGSNTVVGFTSPGGHYALQYSFQEPALLSGTAITLVRPVDAGPSLRGSMSGTFTHADGAPYANVYVWLDNYSTTTDADGYFEVDDVENGTYNLYGAMSCDDAEDQGAWVDGASLEDMVMSPASDGFGDACSLTTNQWIAGTTQPVFTNDYDTILTLPFPIPFYGHSFTTMTMQKWGAVLFTDSTDVTLGGGVQSRPGDDPVIDDQTKFYTATVGTAPNRRFVVEWAGVGLASSPTTRTNFEIVFDEGTGAATNIYQNVPARGLTGSDIQFYYWGTDWNAVLYYEDGNGLHAGKTPTITPPTS